MIQRAILSIITIACFLFPFSILAGEQLASGQRGIGVIVRNDNGRSGSQQVYLYDKMTAVIIGIDRYENLPATQWLKYAEMDARGVAEVLAEQYRFDRIITLYNEQATWANIIKVLQGDLSKLGPEDGVLIYFASHGITLPTSQEKELGFLVPYDGSLKADETYKNISMQLIKSDVAPLVPAKHMLLIADACFGGLLLDTRSASAEGGHDSAYLRRITSEPVRQVLTAGGPGETVLDTGKNSHSVFTGRLIEALSRVDDFITAKELGVQLQRTVYGDAAAQGHEQRPLQGEIYGTGDFVFVPDLARRQAMAEDEVKGLESQLAELARVKEEAAKRKDEAKIREMEREQLQKENELKYARLHEKAARLEEELRQKAEEEAQKDAAEMKRREEERTQRLASLRQKAMAMQEEVGSPAQALGLDEAVKEVRRINETLARMAAEFASEEEKQLKPVREYYRPKIAQAEKVKSWDKMFETEQDYKTRAAKQQAEAARLSTEQAAREQEIKSRIRGELEAQNKSLLGQRNAITTQTFKMSGKEVSFKLIKYHPAKESFFVTIHSGPGLDYFADLPIPKDQAREYYENSDLMVPELFLVVSENGNVKVETAMFSTPTGVTYMAKDFSGGMVESCSGMVFMRIPGGCFQMGDAFGDGDGDEKPVHDVCINDYWLGKYEVTQGQWQKVMGTNPSKFNKADNFPVERVSWLDVQGFLKKLNEKSGKKLRLPTEAEWEYAARSMGKKIKYPWGDVPGNNKANCDGCGSEWDNKSTAPVGSFESNDLGLYDMGGNILEWVQDCHHFYSAGNGKCIDSKRRILRGGAWYNGPQYIRTTERRNYDQDYRSDIIGFRLVLDK